MIAELVGQSVDRLVWSGWSVGQSVWLVGWLVGWLSVVGLLSDWTDALSETLDT